MNRTFRICIYLTTSTFLVGMLSIVFAGGGSLLKKSEVPRAIAKLRRGSNLEKIWAADELGKLGSVRITYVKEAIEPLKLALGTEKDAQVRAAAARALGKIAPEPEKTILILRETLVKDKSLAVKAATVVAIGEMGAAGRIAIPEIRKLARDKSNKQLSKTAKMVLKSFKNQ